MLVNPNDYISGCEGYFLWREAIYLPSWGRLANESDGLNQNIIDSLSYFFLNQILPVRLFLDVPMSVHCGYRPGPYSLAVGGTVNDPHTCTTPFNDTLKVCAIDFNPNWGLSLGEECDKGKSSLLPKLEELGLRMENNGSGATWIHLDSHPVINNRYFSG